MKKRISPYEQGALDGLCGVYSIINAAKKVNGFDYDKCQELFRDVISYLDLQKSLSKLLIKGIDITIIGEILNNVHSLVLDKKQPYHGNSEASLGELWQGMGRFMAEPNRAILIGLQGYHDHWTVIDAISEKQIRCLDSSGIRTLNRSKCTTKEPDAKRIHKIYPGYAYFLSKRE